MDDTRMKLAKFRTACKAVVPYLMHSIYGLIAVERPGIKTMAVDQYARLYYDPAYVERVSLETGRWTILHETLHVVLGHCDLGKRVLGENPTAQMCLWWNIACDIVVNQLLDAWGQDAPEGIYTYQRMGFPPKLSAIEYYRLLAQQEEEKQKQREQQQQESDDSESDDEQEEDDSTDEEGDDEDSDGSDDGESERDDEGDRGAGESGDDQDDGESSEGGGEGGDPDEAGDDHDGSGDGEGDSDGEDSGAGPEGDGGEGEGEDADDAGDPGAGGSGADGQPRSYELPPDSAYRDREYAMASELLDAIEQQEASAPGSVPGEIATACGLRMRPTKIDPWEQLPKVLGRATSSPRGAPDFTLRRLSRRQQKDGPRLRGVVKKLPDCVVLLDTSGSMDLFRESQLKVKALGVIAKGLKRLRSVTVRCGDYDLKNKQIVGALAHMKLEGGGGTDMGRLVEQIDKEDRPTCIVVITDLETGWCDRKPRAKVVIVGVKTPSDRYPTPAWASFVDCSQEGGE
jgi:predicted metal-dependent peptidase